MPPARPKAAKKSPKSAAAKPKSATKKAAPGPKSRASSAPSKKPAPKVERKAATKRAAAPTLTSEQRTRLLKPRAGVAELVERSATAWAARPDVRVPGLTRARLQSLAAKAQRAEQREQALADAQARKLRPLTDARFVADDALWRAVLELYREVKHRAARDASLGDAFGFLTEAFRNERSGAPEGGEPEGDAK